MVLQMNANNGKDVFSLSLIAFIKAINDSDGKLVDQKQYNSIFSTQLSSNFNGWKAMEQTAKYQKKKKLLEKI